MGSPSYSVTGGKWESRGSEEGAGWPPGPVCPIPGKSTRELLLSLRVLLPQFPASGVQCMTGRGGLGQSHLPKASVIQRGPASNGPRPVSPVHLPHPRDAVDVGEDPIHRATRWVAGALRRSRQKNQKMGAAVHGGRPPCSLSDGYGERCPPLPVVSLASPRSLLSGAAGCQVTLC